jgi:hypothetical protein
MNAEVIEMKLNFWENNKSGRSLQGRGIVCFLNGRDVKNHNVEIFFPKNAQQRFLMTI